MTWHAPTRAVLLTIALIFCTALARSERAPVIKLNLHDTIQPISASYLERGIEEAKRRNAVAVLISLGTPGGLLDSTREIVQAIERSPVPVIVYISPPGSRAGSAGFFVLEAADVAAMAPGTNAGAAHPLIEGHSPDPVLKEKIENDAAAFLRSYAARRGRNVQAGEDAIRHSRSYSDQEALQSHLIELVASDDTSLLRQLDGREIHRLDGSATTLHLADAPIVVVMPSMRERLLGRLANPDFAVIVLVFGAVLIYLEFNVPGTIVPGAVGSLLLLLGLFGLNLLPIHYTALFLLLAGFGLILLEAKFTSHGVLGLSGTAALILGLTTLVDGPIPEQRVHLSVAVFIGLAFGLITLFLAFIALRARRNKLLTGPAAMIGTVAIVRTAFSPVGQVEVRGEIWRAQLTDTHAMSHPLPGSQVHVRGVADLTLLVEPPDHAPSIAHSR